MKRVGWWGEGYGGVYLKGATDIPLPLFGVTVSPCGRPCPPPTTLQPGWTLQEVPLNRLCN